jgi:hypothetical protein
MLHQTIKFNDDITTIVAQLIALMLAYDFSLSTYRGNYLTRSRTFSKVQKVHPSGCKPSGRWTPDTNY